MVIDGDSSQDASRRTQNPDSRAAPIRRAGTSRRDSILDAVVALVAERGVADTSVGLVIAGARVSRRTFHECFAGLDECLLAVLDGALERAAPLVVEAFAREGSWQDGMRWALAAMLALFDEEPALARVCMVEMSAAGSLVREHRERIIQSFGALVLARIESEVSHPSPLAAEGAYASVVGIVGARLAGSERRPLIELLGPLMGIIVGPFMDEREVAREIERGEQLARELLAERALRLRASDHESAKGDPSAVPAALRDPRAHRARLCLVYVVRRSARGHSPSNQEIGAAIGVSHRGQLAKLLGRLAELGLLVKRTGAPGHPNAWSATPAGERIALTLAGER
jgi:AcrR family transcriptional regulator